MEANKTGVPMPVRSDAELVKAVQAGDKAAYGGLFRRYERSVLGIALHILKDRHAAEDAAQEIFVTAYSKLGGLRDGAKFGRWLLVVARRHAVRLAKKRRAALPLERIERAGPAPQSGLVGDDSRRLLEAVNRLPKHERLAVSLRYFDGHSVQEIAEMTGRPVGTVTKQLTRAHRRLRSWLERQG
jgi:RNA polymerase sigma-70 factor (ECF subfamily)